MDREDRVNAGWIEVVGGLTFLFRRRYSISECVSVGTAGEGQEEWV